MSNQRIFIAGIIALVVLGAGCDDRSLGPIGPLAIPFELVIPPNRPSGTYYAVSGVTTTTAFIRVGDSIVQSQVPSFYAQFSTEPGTPLPDSVLLNGNPLERNLGTDTLRLATVTKGDVFKENEWTLNDAGGTAKKSTMPQFDIIDSVGPFQSQTSVRGDSALTVGWRPPRSGAGGMTIIWRGPAHTVVLPVNDFIGQATVDAALMKQLTGVGTVTFVRYTNRQDTYKGQPLVLTRITQHSYRVTVQ